MATLNHHIRAIVIALVIVFLSFAVPSFAEKVTFVKEYTYQASELDSKASCRTISLEMVKRLLLEELGTYLLAETEVKDFRLTRDKVVMLTAGIVQTEILNEKWDGERYYLKARIKADPDEVAVAVDRLRKDTQKSKELEDTKKKADEAFKQIEKLKKELEAVKADTNKQKEYAKAADTLSAADWFNKGYAFYDSGRYNESVDAYTKAIELNPEFSEAFRSRGNTYFEIGDYQRAISDYDKAIKFAAQNDFMLSYNYQSRSFAYIKVGNYKSALQDLEESLNLTKQPLRALEGTSLLLKLGDLNKIIKAYPNDFRGYIMRGLYYFGNSNNGKDKRYEQAISDFNRAIKLNPKYALGYYLRGKILYDNEKRKKLYEQDSSKYKRSLNDLNKSEALNLNASYEFYNMRGHINLILGHIDQYIRDLTEAVKIVEPMVEKIKNKPDISSQVFNYSGIYPGTLSSIYGLRGGAYFYTKKYREAINDYTKSIAISEEERDASPESEMDIFWLAMDYSNRGEIYAIIGLYEEAIKDYNKSIELNPDYNAIYNIYFLRGDAYFNLSDFQKAIRDYNKAIEIDSLYAGAYYKRGLVHKILNNYQQATNDFQVAARLGDKSAQSYLKSKKIEW